MKKIIFVFAVLIASAIVTGCTKKTDEKVNVTLSINGEETVVELKKGEEIGSKYDPTLEGFTFEGWYSDAEFSVEFNSTTKIEENLTLYAKLSRFFNISMVIEGETSVVKVGDKLTVKDLESPEIAEKQFVGWYSDAECKKFVPLSTKISSDMTLYGKYIDKIYTITFDTRGGNAIKSIKFSTGTVPEKPVGVPSILGYDFTYWSFDEAGLEQYDFTTSLNSDVVLYANYVEVSYDDLLDSLIPDVIDSNLELPDSKDSIIYNWEISNSSLLSYDGVYNPDKTDQTITITLTLNVEGSDESVTFSKKATIKRYELKSLVAGDVVIGYTSSWYYKGYSEEVLKTTDVLNISFAFVYEDGSLNLNSIGQMLSETVSVAHRNGVRVCLSIQGYGEDTKNFSDCAANPTLRAKLVTSMVDAVKKYRLDGIDIDWEYPGAYSGRELAVDKVNYTTLIKDIRQKLNTLGDGYLLTAAIPAGPWGHSRFELNKLHQYFDYINMMSYDLESSNNSSHHSALYPSSRAFGTTEGCSVDETITLWASYGVPLSKICLGVAFYGKDITISGSYGNGLGVSVAYGSKYSNKAYDAICEKYITKVGDTVNYHFDDSARAPFMVNTQTMKFLTYENELSALYKSQYAKEKGLGGVMIWEIGEDNTNALITAVAQGYDRYIEGKDYLVGGDQSFEVGTSINVKTVKEIADSSLGSEVVFRTSDASIAVINGSKVQFNKSGTVTITATNADGSKVYGTMNVTVK